MTTDATSHVRRGRQRVYIDLQGGLPTLWDQPAPGRRAMAALIENDRVEAILPEPVIADIDQILGMFLDDELRDLEYYDEPEPAHIAHPLQRLAALVAPGGAQ